VILEGSQQTGRHSEAERRLSEVRRRRRREIYFVSDRLQDEHSYYQSMDDWHSQGLGFTTHGAISTVTTRWASGSVRGELLQDEHSYYTHGAISTVTTHWAGCSVRGELLCSLFVATLSHTHIYIYI